MSKNKICVLIPFFGKWPKHFSLFLKSCSYNSSLIDYLFLTDILPPKDFPSNVSFTSFSLNDFNQLASKKLEIEINVNSPYKLCDFKPAYGYIFSDYLKDYQYWGHGDEDLLLGDVNLFIKEPIELDYDIISFRKEWVSGSFCLFKNTEPINALFKNSKHYPKVYQINEHLAFDECFKLWSQVLNGNNLIDIDIQESMTTIILKEQEKSNIKAYFQTRIKESIAHDSYILFDRGRILLNGEKEFLAYHYITEKKSPVFTIPDWSEIPDKFYIDKTGFFTEKEWKNPVLKKQITQKRKKEGRKKELNNLLKRVKNKFLK